MWQGGEQNRPYRNIKKRYLWYVTGLLPWVGPPSQDSSDHQDYEKGLVGDPKK